MPTDDWEEAIDAADAVAGSVTAHTYLRSWPSASRPVLLRCDDGHDYVVKGAQTGRTVINEHVVGRLGKLVGAPVGQVAIVTVPDALVNAEPQMAHVTPGPAHGSRFLPHCGDRENLLHTDVPENRDRFARLAILYGWMGATDHQFIYENQPPHRVHSVDHGHFFNGPGWTEASLAALPSAALDVTISTACGFTDDEVGAAAATIPLADDAAIASVVAGPPDAWGMSKADRVALASTLATRREALIAATATGEGQS
jgi:hypothetical protein